MTEPSHDIARAAAGDLEDTLNLPLTQFIEAEIQQPGSLGGMPQYMDPATGIALASLIVSVASLAWTIIRDLSQGNKEVKPQILSRKVSLQLEIPKGIPREKSDQIIKVVVEKTISYQ